MKDLETPSQADFTRSLKYISIKNVDDLETFSKKVDDYEADIVDTIILEHLPSLKRIDVAGVVNKITKEKGKLYTFELKEVYNLEHVDFSGNNISTVHSFKDIVENLQSDHLYVNGDDNNLYDATPFKLVKPNMKIELRYQTPDLPDVLNNVGVTGTYDFDQSFGTFSSPYPTIYSEISVPGEVDGSKIRFEKFKYNEPSQFDFKWVSNESNENGTFEYSGAAVQKLNYPVESFSSSEFVKNPISYYTDEIEYTVKFKANGMDGLPVFDYDILLQIPERTEFVEDSITVSDGEYTVSDTTLISKRNKNLQDDEVEKHFKQVAFGPLETNKEYVVKYRVKVVSEDIDVNVESSVIIGYKSYAEITHTLPLVRLVESHVIEHKFVDRNGVALKDSFDIAILNDNEYLGKEYVIDDFIYVGYQIDQEEIQYTKDLPHIASVNKAYSIKYIYGVKNPDEDSELVHTVNESYVNRNNDSLVDSKSSQVYSTTAFVLNKKDVDGYLYLGYTLNNSVLLNGYPDTTRVEDDMTIVYVYGIKDKDNPSQELEISVTEKFVDRKLRNLKDSKVTSLKGHESFVVDDNPTHTNYVYLGYYLNKDYDHLITEEKPALINLTTNQTIEYVFGVEDGNTGEELIHTVTEKHVDRQNKKLENDTVSNIESQTDYFSNELVVDDYIYVGYRISNGPFIKASDKAIYENLDKDLEVTYVYGLEDKDNPGEEKYYSISEKHVDRKGREVFDETSVSIAAFDNYEGKQIISDKYIYIGYLDTDSNLVLSGDNPSLNNVSENHLVTFVYGLKNNENEELKVTITEKYETRTFNKLSDDTSVVIPGLMDYKPTVKSIDNRVYVGYRINGGSFVETTNAPSFENLEENFTITFIYGVEDDENPGYEKKYSVSQNYVKRNGETFENGNSVLVPADTPFIPNIKSYDDYKYLGFSINGREYIYDIPVISSVTEALDLVYLYGYRDEKNPESEKKLTITENYVDRKGRTVSDTTNKTLFYHEDYTIDKAETVESYVYIGYKLNASDTINSGLPTLSDIRENHTINYVYGFEDVTDKGSELEVTITQKHQNRKGDKIDEDKVSKVFGLMDYKVVANTIDDYKLVGYTLNGVYKETTQLPIFEDMVSSVEITLVYGLKDPNDEDKELTISLTEKFVDRVGRELKQSSTLDINVYADYNGSLKSIDKYVYLGYQIDDNTSVLDKTLPALKAVESDHSVKYIYGVKDGESEEELTHTVVQRYVNRANTIIGDAESETVYSTNPLTVVKKDVQDYKYLGYTINDRDFKTGYPTIDSVSEDLEITYLYGYLDDENVDQEKEVTIVETYKDRKDRPLKDSVETKKYVFEDFTKQEADKIDNYVLLGYTINNSTLITTGLPDLKALEEDVHIEYLYGIEDDKHPGEELFHTVTIKYQDRKGSQLSDDIEVKLPSLTDFKGQSKVLNDYLYVGYKLEGMFDQSKELPSIEDLDRDITIIYVYGVRDLNNPDEELMHKVTETFVNRNNDPIKVMIERDLPSLGSVALNNVESINDYFYIGYRLNAGSLIEGNPEILVLSDDVQLEYLYGLKDDQTGVEKEVVLTERFVSRKNVSIKDTVTTNFKAHESFAITDKPQVDNHVYVGYRIDNDETLHTGLPILSNMTQNHTIHYVFGVEDPDVPEQELMVKITEKHLNRKGDEIAPDFETTIEGKTDYQTKSQSINDYLYIGYVIDGQFVETSVSPSFEDILEDIEIIHIYGVEDDKEPGVEKKYTVKERHVDRNNVVFEETSKEYGMFEDFIGNIKTYSNHVYVAYQINDDAIDSTKSIPSIKEIGDDYVVTYIYGIKDPSDPSEELIYNVTEKHQNRIGLELVSDTYTKVFADTIYNGSTTGVSDYVYVGYQIEGYDFIETSEYPKITDLVDDITVIYVYGKKNDLDEELKHTVTLNYVDISDKKLHDTEVVLVTDILDYSAEYKDIEDYKYIGYKLDDGILVDGPALPELLEVVSDHTITFVYDVKVLSDITIEERFVDTKGNTIQTSKVQTITERDSYTSKAPVFDNYKYKGYRIDNGSLQDNDVSLDYVIKDTIIEFVYEKGVDKPDEKTPPTGVDSNGILYLSILVLAFILLIEVIKRKSQIS